MEFREGNDFRHGSFVVVSQQFFHPDGIVPASKFMEYPVEFSRFAEAYQKLAEILYPDLEL